MRSRVNIFAASAYVSVALLTLSVSQTYALSTPYLTCPQGQSCVLGEFIYDDNFNPIVGGSCTLKGQDPNGSTYLNSVAAPGNDKGWYSYSVPTTENTVVGVYPTQLCCTADGDYICTDKTFQVTTPTGADVWSYYNNIITGLFNRTGAAGTAPSSFSGLTNLSNLTAMVRESRDMIETIAKAPTVSTFMEEDPGPTINTKLAQTQEVITTTYTNLNLTTTDLSLLISKWDELTPSATTLQLQRILSSLGSPPGEKSLKQQLSWLNTAWDEPLITIANQDLDQAITQLSQTASQLTGEEKGLQHLITLTSVAQKLFDLQKTIGDISNSSTDPTLYAFYLRTKGQAQALDEQNLKLAEAADAIDPSSTATTTDTFTQLAAQVFALNKLPNIQNLFSQITQNASTARNKLFGLQAVVNLNRSHLAQNNPGAVLGTWIEEGKITFHTIISNPSTRLSQTATIDFLLPKEIKPDHIESLDPSLSSTYDPQADALRIKGSVDLAPMETRTFAIVTSDIWKMPPGDFEGLKNQAAELLKPLEKTSFFGQAVTIKGDIDMALDTAAQLMQSAKNPRTKIQAYRQAKLLTDGVKNNINKLRDLVAEAGNTGSIFGFVGGIQTTAVWGIVLIFITGFVFLTIYMRTLISRTGTGTPFNLPLITPRRSKVQAQAIPAPRLMPQFTLPPFLIQPFTSGKAFHILLIILCSTLLSLIVTGYVLPSQKRAATPKAPIIMGNLSMALPSPTPLLPTPTPTPMPSETPVSSASAVKAFALGDQSIIITVPTNGYVNVREAPNTTAKIITQLTKTTLATELDNQPNWIKVEIDFAATSSGLLTGWVNAAFIDTPPILH